jgi:CRP-like cAMP-binding protein
MRVSEIPLSEVNPMSATLPSSSEEASSNQTKEERLRSYLEQKAEDGEVYFKSKFISEEVGLSPKEIGALMVKLKESASDLEVEKWSYTSATTWRVSRA